MLWTLWKRRTVNLNKNEIFLLTFFKKRVRVIDGVGNSDTAKLRIEVSKCTTTKLSPAKNVAANSFSPPTSNNFMLKKDSQTSHSVVSPAEMQGKMLAVDQEKCMTQHVLNAEIHARFHSSQGMTVPYTAASASLPGDRLTYESNAECL